MYECSTIKIGDCKTRIKMLKWLQGPSQFNVLDQKVGMSVVDRKIRWNLFSFILRLQE